jgi:integrase
MRAAKGATSKAHAQRMLAEIERSVMHGRLGIPEPTAEELEHRTITVAQLGERFVESYSSPGVKDIQSYRKSAKSKFAVRINPRIGDRKVVSLTGAVMERLRDELLTELEPASVKQTLATLSKAFNWGRRQGLIGCDNPVKGVERPKVGHSIDYLSKEEVQRLLAHTAEAAPDLHPLVATAIYTGLRKGELFGLRWRHVDLDRARLDVEHSYSGLPKSGQRRHLRINPRLLPILRAWRDRCPATDAGLVFPVCARSGVWGMGSEYSMLALPALLKGAGCHLPEKPWHSLRHTFASHFVMSGGNILSLQKALGHGTLDMTLRYAHFTPDFMAAEIDRMSFDEVQADVVPIATARK